MVEKKKSGKLDVTAAVKAAARECVGAPKPTRAIPDARQRQLQRGLKHKETLAALLDSAE